jgi:(2Fe-2S) ferredoxin
MTETQTTKTASAAKSVTTRACNCGCGLATSSSKTMYKPGHDARHAGNVARRIVENHLSGDAAQAVLKELPTANLQHKAGKMVTRLIAKAEAAAIKELAKVAARQAKTTQKAPRASKADRADKRATAILVAQEEDAHAAAELAKRAEIEADITAELDGNELPAPVETVKMGRWEYPARRDPQNPEQLQRNTKRDGSGEWVEFNGKA